MNSSSIRNLVEEVRSIVANLKVTCFSVVHQDDNEVVHKLARHAKFSSHPIIWVDEYPAFLFDVLLVYLNSI